MPAVIQSTLYVTPGGAVVPGSTQTNSRDDLHLGYQVVLHSVHAATTYSWSLSFASDSPGSAVPGTPFDGTQSASALLPPEGSTSQDAKFNVDFEGSYLLRLTVDAGLPTEDTQFIRCRLLTLFGAIKLVAAGERRDENGVIPVDASPEGWANDQNANLQRVSLLLRRLATSGRVLYVDANRGRDSAADQNDYSNVISIPGTEVARSEETGIKVRAMAHGDFSSINDAIAYAVAAAARGEPAPSKTDPYYILIQPGYYTEDLNLTSFVHLVGLGSATDDDVTGLYDGGPSEKAVIVRTVNAGGTGTHRYNPQGLATAEECFLHNLYLENTANTTSPVLDHQGGLLRLVRCVVQQGGDAVLQGEALRCVVANPLFALQLWVLNSHIRTLATVSSRVALRVDATDSLTVLRGSTVQAEHAIAMAVNETLYEHCVVHVRDNSQVVGDVAYRGYAESLVVEASQVRSWGAPVLPAIEVSGSGPKAGDVNLTLRDSLIQGAISFSTANAVGSTSYVLSGVMQTDVDPAQGVLLPDAPGDTPDTSTPEMRADSLWYVKGYEDPRAPGVPLVPLLNQVDVEDVQRAIDILWQGAFPVTGSPFYSLDSAYNGASSLFPFTPGVGLGRNISALGGAVQVQGATWPTGPESHLKYGGMQVEGVVDIGMFINGVLVDDTLASVGGSEIHLNPNLSGSGPLIGLGRVAWPNGVTQPDRGFGAGMIVAGGSQLQVNGGAFHLHLRTVDQRAPNTGKSGNVYVVAGGIGHSSAHDAGEVHIVGGSPQGAAGTLGNVWLVPGNAAGPTTGAVWFVGAPNAPATRASLTPANAFVPGTAGTIYFGTPSGIETIILTGAEANAAAVATSIETQARSVTAADVGGKVVLYSEYGPAGDILYMGDSGSGNLNTALGDYILGSGAVFVPGVYGDKVSVDVPVDGRLRVNGDLEYTGTLIPLPTSLGSIVTLAAGVHALGANVAIVDSQPAGGAVWLGIPAGATDGRMLILRQEDAGSTRVIANGGETIMGLPHIEFYEGEGVALFKDEGTNWKGWVFYTRPGTESYYQHTLGGGVTIAPRNWWKVFGVSLVAGANTLVTLDATLPVGRQITIKDEDGLANTVAAPAGQQITIMDGGVGTIDGAASLDITEPYGSVTLVKNGSGNWSRYNVDKGRLGSYVTITHLDGPAALTPYDIPEGIDVVGVDCSVAAVWVRLPAGSANTKTVLVKDESFTAGVNNITVLPPAGKTLDGDPSRALAINKVALTTYRGSGGNWFIY